MELKELLATARRWWGLIVLLVVLGGAAAFGISFLIPPVFEASTTILINPAQGALPDAQAVISGQRVASTYAELLRQRPVLEEVIKELNLRTDPDTLDKQIQVSPVRDTNLLSLSVRDSDANRAANIANKMVEVFINQTQQYQSERYASSLKDLQTQLDTLDKEMSTTQARLDALAGSTDANDVAERTRLQSLLVEDRQSESSLRQSYDNIRLAQAQTSDTINVVETALPGRKVTSLALNVLLGVVAGLVLAVGLVFLIEYLRETVTSHEEIEDLIGAPTLGVIGHIPGGDAAMITVNKPRSPIAEAYRLLRANIDFSGADLPLRTLLVTSSSPSEGKTTTMVNLAIASAQFGKQVILVDADLRRPMLHKVFGQPNTRGLSTALQQNGGGMIHDHLVPTGIENLYLMPSGPLPPNPADLLGSRRLADLLEKLKTMADLIYFDSPPVLAVADSALLARMCDATLLVVLSDSTRGDVLRRAKEQLEQSGAKLLGVVLNKVSSSRDGYYYYRSYYSRKDNAS